MCVSKCSSLKIEHPPCVGLEHSQLIVNVVKYPDITFVFDNILIHAPLARELYLVAGQVTGDTIIS